MASIQSSTGQGLPHSQLFSLFAVAHCHGKTGAMFNVAGHFERFPSVPPLGDLDLLLSDGKSMGEPAMQVAAKRQVGPSDQIPKIIDREDNRPH